MQPPTVAEGPVRIQERDSRWFAANVRELMTIYAAAMQYPSTAAVQRALTAKRHVDNEGFACRLAVWADETIIGFGYGYTTRTGQWWHELVRRALDAEVAGQWLSDAFELSEMHVLPGSQGHGVGRRLLTDLAVALPHRAMVLSTPDRDTRAFRLYRSTGFVDLRRDYLFPGDARPFAILGARLPLTAPGASPSPGTSWPSSSLPR